MEAPDTRYARSGDVNIAYQVLGDGPVDLVMIPGWIFHLDVAWEDPSWERILRRLTSDFRVILFDKRGTGLSDRGVGGWTLEERMDDVRAVMDAAGSDRAAVMGWSEGGTIGLLFAATYPERVSHLLLYGSAARFAQAPDYPAGFSDGFVRAADEMIGGTVWGQGYLSQFAVPSRADDERFRQWFGRYERLSVAPGEAKAMMKVNMELDLRHILSSVRVPTLVIHQTGDRVVPVEMGRYIAERIPGARMVELPGEDHLFWFSNSEDVVAAIREFVVGAPTPREADRVLATVLFTDIVGSTDRAARMGDRRWRSLLEDHHALAQQEIARFLGRGVKTMGDGVLATFDGPARAIRCAEAIRRGVHPLGLEIRAGLHTGEIEVLGDDVGGIAVHIGARVSTLADPDEVLVSSTVRDLVAGSGIEFEDRGTHALKGVQGEWRLFAVTSA